MICIREGSKNDFEFLLFIETLSEGYTGENRMVSHDPEVVEAEKRKILRYCDTASNYGDTEIDNCPKFTFIAMNDDEKVGMIMFTFRDYTAPGFQPFGIFDKLDLSIFPEDGRFCEIFNLWVDPRYRRKGVATLLKRHAEKVSREHGYSMIYTHTEVKNSHVVQLNLNLGYRIIRTGPLWDVVERVSMIKYL